MLLVFEAILVLSLLHYLVKFYFYVLIEVNLHVFALAKPYLKVIEFFEAF